jgi:hypothetical protein
VTLPPVITFSTLHRRDPCPRAGSSILQPSIEVDGDTNSADFEFEFKLESVVEQRNAWSRTEFEEQMYNFILSGAELFGLRRVGPVLCSNRAGLYERYVDGGDLNGRLI